MTDREMDLLDVADLPWNLHEAELVLIKRALAQTQGNISRAAKLLGIHRMKIYRRLAQEETVKS